MSDEMKYLKLYLDEIDMWREVLSIEEIGYLFVATASYMKDGTIIDVPNNVRFAFFDQKRKVDLRKAVYKSKVDNGQNGGKTKEENAKIQKDTGYRPPSKRKFKTIIQELLESKDILEKDFSSKAVDEFFAQLRDSRWAIRGEPIRSDADLTIVLRSKFERAPHEPKRSLFFQAFEVAFAAVPPLRDSNGNSLAEDVASDFFDTFDNQRSVFVVGEQDYPANLWEAALQKFIEQWTENIPP